MQLVNHHVHHVMQVHTTQIQVLLHQQHVKNVQPENIVQQKQVVVLNVQKDIMHQEQVIQRVQYVQ